METKTEIGVKKYQFKFTLYESVFIAGALFKHMQNAIQTREEILSLNKQFQCRVIPNLIAYMFDNTEHFELNAIESGIISGVLVCNIKTYEAWRFSKGEYLMRSCKELTEYLQNTVQESEVNNG